MSTIAKLLIALAIGGAAMANDDADRKARTSQTWPGGPAVCFAGSAPHAPSGTPQVYRIGGGPGPLCVLRASPQLAGQNPRFASLSAVRGVSDDDQSPALPPVWIGVRLTPVPEPLAAHLGEEGLMIANVAKDSPADKAGLERYDVIVEFKGEGVSSLEALSKAIQEVGAGNTAEIVVLRKGKRKTLTIRPQESPSQTPEYKYEEPEAPAPQSQIDLGARILKRLPDGKWTLEDIGKLERWPEEFQKFFLQQPFGAGDWKFDVPGLDAPAFRFGFDVWKGWSTLPDGARVEISISVDENGDMLTVHRSSDGKVRVVKKKAGQESSATYDSLEQFEREDPEGYGRYQKYAGFHGVMPWIRVQPQLEKLPQMRKEFQKQLEEHLRKAQGEATRALEKARRNVEEALREHELRVGTRVEVGDAATDVLAVTVTDDGVTVKTSRDGEETTHTFKNMRELKRKDPELYERVKELIE